MKLASSGRTLIVQPLPGIGDMVWHLPHIHAIAATTMEGRVDLLTKPRSQADRLLRADPRVGQILWLEREVGRHAGPRGLLRLAALLRRQDYQRAWFLHGSARYVLAARRWTRRCPCCPFRPRSDQGAGDSRSAPPARDRPQSGPAPRSSSPTG